VYRDLLAQLVLKVIQEQLDQLDQLVEQVQEVLKDLLGLLGQRVELEPLVPEVCKDQQELLALKEIQGQQVHLVQ